MNRQQNIMALPHKVEFRGISLGSVSLFHVLNGRKAKKTRPISGERGNVRPGSKGFG